MTSQTIPFNELSFSTLFCDYCRRREDIMDFYQSDPFSDDALIGRAQAISHPVKPGFREALLAYNDISEMHPRAVENLEALSTDPETRTIVTGQQVTFAGGTLFTVYKILTAIVRADAIEKKTGKKVVPVFWVADEDQDFDEIARIGFPNGNEWGNFELTKPDIMGQRAAQTRVQDDISSLIDAVESALPPTDHRDEIIGILRGAYIPGSAHTDSFAKLISRLFSHFGLLIFGSAKPETRVLIGDCIKSLLDKTDEIYEALETTSQNVEKKYHRQASVGPSNWFLVDANGVRVKLNFEDGIWSTHDGRRYTTAQLKGMMDQDPGSLSPNVFMRPLLQDTLLPNLALVAGPGEIAYYAQLKSVYAVCDIQMPVIIPRFSATVFEGLTRKYFQELPFRLSEYKNRIEDLESAFIEKTQDLDLQSFFDTWSKGISSLADSGASVVEQVDPTLIGTLKKIESDQINTLNQLKGKMFKAIKQKQDVQLKRISRVQMALYPNRNLQERTLAFIYILNKYGTGFLDDLAELIAHSSLDEHHLIDL